MSKIVDSCGSLSTKIASLKQLIRADATKKEPKLTLEQKVDEEVQKQRDKLPKKSSGQPDEAEIDLSKAIKKATKRKDSQPTTPTKPTALCDRLFKTIENKKDDRPAKKTPLQLKYPLRIPKSPIAR